MADHIYQKVLNEDTVKINKYAELSKDFLHIEVDKFKKKFDQLKSKTQTSLQHRKIPENILPSIEDGNYSLVLYDKNAFDVNDWIKADMRTYSHAMSNFKSDIKKFEEYDSFDFKEINSIKCRNQVDFIVEHNYSPVDVNMSSDGHKPAGVSMYPSTEVMTSVYKDFIRDKDKNEQKDTEKRFHRELEKTKEVMQATFSSMSTQVSHQKGTRTTSTHGKLV